MRLTWGIISQVRNSCPNVIGLIQVFRFDYIYLNRIAEKQVHAYQSHVPVCAFVRAFLYVCVCVCVCVREREVHKVVRTVQRCDFRADVLSSSDSSDGRLSQRIIERGKKTREGGRFLCIFSAIESALSGLMTSDRKVKSDQSEKFLDLGTVMRPPSSIYARVNCFVIRDWYTRVQGHPRNLFRRPWIFGLLSPKHHT